MEYCKSNLTAIVKPVNGSYNLSCSYCYTRGLKSCVLSCMQSDTLKATVDFFCSNQDDIEFIWHGGEPLLAGLDFYHQVVKFQRMWKQQGKHISNFVQTNATLVTSEWAKFFVENDFIVAVSLDGPKGLHNQVRHYSNSIGSFDDVMNGIRLLQETEIFNGVICCISQINIQHHKIIFDFLVANNLKKLKFSRVKNIGHCDSIDHLAISTSEYFDFMVKIFDLWLELDDTEVEIRDIQSVVNLILGGNRRECINMGNCDRFVTVYSNGSIFSCDSFPRSEKLSFGNVSEGYESFRLNPKLVEFQRILKKRSDRCRDCKWYNICRGGCAKDYYEHLESIEPIDEVCRSRKRYLEYLSEKTRSMILPS